MLEALGLTTIDQEAYETWLRNPSWTAAQVARHLGEKEDAVLASRAALIREGLLVDDPRRPGQLAPVVPDVVLAQRLADIEAAAARQRANAMRARVHLSAMMAAQLTGDGGGPGQRIRSWPLRQAKLDELVRGASREIVALQSHRPAVHGLTGASADLDRCALRRGVAIRALYPHDRLVHQDDLAYVGELVSEGGQVRTAADVAATAIVVDRVTAVLTTGHEGRLETVIVIDPAVSETLAALFESCWAHSQRLGGPDHTASAGGGLSDSDRRLLQLLALGVTDESAARSMGISVRTVRRHVSLLLDRLGAASRFQAGVQAAQRGWL
ncbi:LuxR C-terminal-related transcriptional regulator [Micromonospora parva]|uniref:helix-turn-helix transcriptional regulator n=1 Tax=Micromonospora TaxID=1873 RepID=UPI00068BC478|nr:MULTISPECIES: LuxR C-terminal-related transcriptional regulator [Micromonospora]MBQ1030408.1 hypothetical protein [Micromonospora sp. C97]